VQTVLLSHSPLEKQMVALLVRQLDSFKRIPQLHYCVHKSEALGLILRPWNPAVNPTPNFYAI